MMDTISEFEKLIKNTDSFISCNNSQDDSSENIKEFLKKTYDSTVCENLKIKSNGLPELIIQDFDLEQIWQQLELHNEGAITKLLINVSKLCTKKNKLIFTEIKDAQGQDDDDDKSEGDKDAEEETKTSGGVKHNESFDDESDEEEIELKKQKNIEDDESFDEGFDMSKIEDSENDEHLKDDINQNRNKKRNKKSIVDDDFFKLSEMEDFLTQEEKIKEEKKNEKKFTEDESEDDEEEGLDLFEESEGDDEDKIQEEDDEEESRMKNPKYDDFFVATEERNEKRKRNKFLEEQSDESDREVRCSKSTFELREERLKKKIKHIEEEALSEKPWQLKGEVTSQNRPENSLLEKVLEFDLISRPAPVITEETTLKLEDIIRQRIKDKVFDSVVRKEKPVETPLEYKKKLTLDSEKSKESLAQIYEKEFLQQKEALDPDTAEKEEEEPQLHKDIRNEMNSLFIKLDALSNFHYTPRPAAPELKIVSNLPAINMEEVAPIAATDASALAPEEIKPKTKGHIISASERTATDKKRERRKKKLKQRQHALEKKKIDKVVNKLNPGLGNKYSKEKMKKALQALGKNIIVK